MENLVCPLSPMSELFTTEYLLEQLQARNPQGIPSTREIIRELGNRRCQEALEPIRAALHDSEPEVRASAAQALGSLGDVRAVACLCCVLREFDPSDIQLGRDHEPVWVEAAKALGQIGDPRAVETLMAIVENRGQSIEVRIEAVRALGAIGDPESLSTLENLIDHPSPDLRVESSKARQRIAAGTEKPSAIPSR